MKAPKGPAAPTDEDRTAAFRQERLRLDCLDRAIESTARQLGASYGTSTAEIITRAREFYLFVGEEQQRLEDSSAVTPTVSRGTKGEANAKTTERRAQR